MYQIWAGSEILYQGFDKYTASEFWTAIQDANIPGQAFFNGTLIDCFDPLDLTIEDPFDFGDMDFDDLDGFEFL